MIQSIFVFFPQNNVDPGHQFYYIILSKLKGNPMNRLYLFIIRLLAGGLIAFIIMRIFRPDAGPVYVIGFGALLVGLAYGFEYFRKRKSSD